MGDISRGDSFNGVPNWASLAWSRMLDLRDRELWGSTILRLTAGEWV